MNRNEYIDWLIDNNLSTKNNTLRLGNYNFKKIPKDIFKLKDIEYIDLTGNYYINIPKNLYKLTKLKGVIINNSLDNIRNIENLIKIDNLKYLNLSMCGLKNIPEWIGELKNLETIIISENDISDIPNFIFNLKELQHINLYHNNISRISFYIKRLKKLKKIDLSYNSFYGKKYFNLQKKIPNVDIINNEIYAI